MCRKSANTMSTSGSSEKRNERSTEAQVGKLQRDAVLDRVAELWKDRDDLPDFTALRKEWDRACPK